MIRPLLAGLLALALPTPAPAADPFSGTYGYGFHTKAKDLRSHNLEIERRADGRYELYFTHVTATGCIGMLVGLASRRGTALVLEQIASGTAEPVEGRETKYHQADDDCRVTVTKRGRALAVEETGGCYSYHGALCAFDGLYRRAGALPKKGSPS